MGFDTLGLAAPVLEAVEEAGYTDPTPIQAQAIPIILEGKDVIGASQTGTGKTAAFALPTLSKIEKMGKPQILVLEPTRELAHQVAEQFEKYGKHTGMTVALLYGGVGYGVQCEQLEAGADIVVATPGRLVDHFYRTSMRFGEIKVLILDEVDRMLDMGFLPQVRKIVNLCPWDERQTLFFSATMPAAIQTFAQWCLTDPQSIEIARASIPSTVTHAFYPVAMDQRDELLLALLKQTDYHSVMIFTRTRKEADQLTSLIKSDGQQKVVAMHSDVNQVDRMKALAGFKEGKYEILVATDVAARGIDISGVSHVINYRVPENAEDYVHRIGRTGRAEAEGDAFTILTADELDYAKSVEIFIDQKIKRSKLENFDYIYTALLDTSPPKPVRKRRPGGGGKKRRR
ncbi:MAG: DEAD/DEAH box helicase [Verrucomicrobiales bacterium]|nr:DEAD/DEAH box helicase [Verrucomicrobiota bacterium JB025]